MEIDVKYTENSIIVGEVEIPLEEIITNINKLKIQKENLCILKLEWEGNRNFDGAYEYKVMPLENALKFKEVFLGFNVYFGEIAGKHSDIYGTIDEDDIKIISTEDNVNYFLKSYPEGIEYNHSFLDRIYDQLSDMDDEEIKDYMSVEEFSNLIGY